MDWKLGVARMVAEKERVLMDLQDVFEYAFDEIFVTDDKGIVVRVNSTCERHYQLAAKELVGKHVKELQKDGIFYPSATLEVIEKRDQLNSFKRQNQESIYMFVQGLFLMMRGI